MRAALLFLFSASALVAACEEPTPDPDPDGGTLDAAVDAGKPAADLGVVGPAALPQGQLHPSVEEAASDAHVLRGRLGAHGVLTATSPRHRLRGGFRPLTR